MGKGAADHGDGEHKSFMQKVKSCRPPRLWYRGDDGKMRVWDLTGKEWGQIFLAYTLFYAFLIGLFCIMFFAGKAIRDGSTTFTPAPGTSWPCQPGTNMASGC
mmetsp:Transcript_17834/g.30999  ORF Transcript_17834/g.30999 Transcript_17834/m.30999 type:complete len:103 (-) Transcript_17834:232-540(-)